VSPSVPQAPAGLSASGEINAVELIEDKLYLVGGIIPLDRGQASWAPDGATGYQTCNSYVLLGEQPLIVDTALEYVQDAVMAGLQQVLSPGTATELFLTRSQLDCVGNLGAIADVYQLARIFTGGGLNVFDSFGDATSVNPTLRARDLEVLRTPEECPLEIYGPPLRVLATSWGYESQTRTLFSSDTFSHVVLENPDDSWVVDSPDVDHATADDLRAHLYASIWWLPGAEKSGIRQALRDFFDSHTIDIIAPSRGCVLRGEDVVGRHIEMLLSVLGED
jgi:flavorubredoxin